MSRYFKINRYIFEIELTENSKPTNAKKYAENRSDIVDKLNATYDTTEFKIINIIDMDTNEKIDSYNMYTINNTYKTERKYFKSYHRAFLDEFHKNKNYLYFKNGYAGIIKHYYIDGHLSAEFYIVNDKKNGLCKKYYMVYNGTDRIQEEKHYINGKIHGLCREYDNKENLIKESNYIDHKLNGLCREYNNEGILIKEYNYLNDIKQGIITEYDAYCVKIELWKRDYGYSGKQIPQEKMDKIRDYINTILSE